MKSVNLFVAISILSLTGCLCPKSANQCSQALDPSCGTRYFVAQLDKNADDSNPGTEVKPFKTINGCLKKVEKTLAPGDTIFVKNGTYRESISLTGDKDNRPGYKIRSGKNSLEMIKIQSYPGDKPVIKGSDVVTGWKKYKGDIWVKEGWNFNSQQVFADDKLLDQIGGVMGTPKSYLMTSWHPKNKGKTLADIYAGSFHYDIDAKKLYVWLKDNKKPEDALVEADARTLLVYIGNLEYIGIGGFKLRHGSNKSYEAAIAVNGSYCVIENIDQAWHAFGGGFVGGEYLTFSKCKFNHNGNNGMGGRNRGNRVLYCETKYNNYRNWSSGWHAGGTKFIPSCHDWIVRGHVSAYNNGDGIWFDGWMSNVTIEECVSYRNRGSGIHYEIGTRAVIKNNLLYENGMRGIYLSNASYSLVANNLCYRNGMSGVTSVVAGRKDKNIYTRGEENLIPGGNNIVRGNILVDNSWIERLIPEVPKWGLSEYMELCYLKSYKKYDLKVWGNRPELIMPMQKTAGGGSFSDYNIFYRSPSRIKPEKLPFAMNWDVGYAYGLDDWSKKTGWDKNSIFAKPKFVDEENFDFQPAEGCPSLWFVKKSDQGVKYALDGSRPGYHAPVTAGPYGGDIELFKKMAKKMSVDKNLISKLPAYGSVNRHKLTKIPYTLISELKKYYLTPLLQGIKLNKIPFFMETRGVIYLTDKNPVANLNLNWTTKELYILFAAENMEKQPFAKITARRDDGVNIEIDLKGNEKDGFSATILKDKKETPVTLAWEGKVKYYSGKTRVEPAKLYMLKWTNDNPWLPITKVDFKLLDPKAEMTIVGVSGESNIK